MIVNYLGIIYQIEYNVSELIVTVTDVVGRWVLFIIKRILTGYDSRCRQVATIQKWYIIQVWQHCKRIPWIEILKPKVIPACLHTNCIRVKICNFTVHNKLITLLLCSSRPDNKYWLSEYGLAVTSVKLCLGKIYSCLYICVTNEIVINTSWYLFNLKHWKCLITLT